MKRVLKKIVTWEYFWLTLMVIGTLAMHLSVVTVYHDTILDEVYYAGYYPELHGDLHYGDAYNILTLHNDARPEHPPLSKLLIAAGIAVLGDNVWGWRVPPILFGTISLVLFFFICRRLGMSRTAVNLATFFLAFETCNFCMNSVAMLDAFVVTTMLAFMLLYLYHRYVLSGVFVGLAATTKLYAVLAAPSLLVHWLFSRTKPSRRFVLTIIIAPVAFVAAVTVFDSIIYREFMNPFNHIKDMLTLSSSLTFTTVDHPNEARPWEWLLNYRPMAFWFSSYTPYWLGGFTCAVSLAIWPFTIPLVLYMTYRAFKGSEAGLFGVSWFIGTFVLWLPFTLITNRVSFIFYYFPAMGAYCLGMGMGLAELIKWLKGRRKRVQVPIWCGIGLLIAVHLATFVVLTPVFIRA
jgi:predicted membrane-bound dolichyl-phosphate-mannose-protein mannosyltransferase